MRVEIERMRIRPDDAQAVWYSETSTIHSDDGPARILVDGDVVWESTP